MYGSSGFRLTGASCFVLLTVWLLVYYRTLDNFSTGYAEIVVDRVVIKLLMGDTFETHVVEPFLILCGVERIDATETIVRVGAELILVACLTPETVAVVIILHTPATEVPLDICLHCDLLTTLFSDLIAALDAAGEFAGEQSCSRTPTYVVDHVGSHAKHVGSIGRCHSGERKLHGSLSSVEKHLCIAHEDIVLVAVALTSGERRIILQPFLARRPVIADSAKL